MIARAVVLTLLLAVPLEARAAGYQVQPGDSLSAIAARYHVSVSALAQANRIANINVVRVGTVLLIPRSQRAVNTFWYRVRWGDTLGGLGDRYGLTEQTIRDLNPRLGVYPLAGEWLKLCSGCASVSLGASSQQTSSGSATFYTVRVGDSLTSIAARFGTTVSALFAANRLIDPNLVVIGSRLQIPADGGGAYDPWSARSVIAEFAASYRVPVALALAVSWQESGFNQSEISSTGAIGVMQVEPYTGNVIEGLLGRPFNLYQLRDNVEAGVFWLSYLLGYYSGNERLAVGAYYQGTRSIAQHGFFQDTTQYVQDVLSLENQFGG